jgi:hypothetical protein
MVYDVHHVTKERGGRRVIMYVLVAQFYALEIIPEPHNANCCTSSVMRVHCSIPTRTQQPFFTSTESQDLTMKSRLVIAPTSTLRARARDAHDLW